VDLRLCTGNEGTPVVVDEVNADQGTGESSDVNADEGAGESSDEKGNNIHLQLCSFTNGHVFDTALTLQLSTGCVHNLTTGDIREIASGLWPNYKVCCIAACE